MARSGSQSHFNFGKTYPFCSSGPPSFIDVVVGVLVVVGVVFDNPMKPVSSKDIAVAAIRHSIVDL